jgi:cysteinyl-tRNA synthetase, unknown class
MLRKRYHLTVIAMLMFLGVTPLFVAKPVTSALGHPPHVTFLPLVRGCRGRAPTLTSTPTATPSPDPSATPSETPTPTPSATPSPTPSPSATPTATPSPDPSATPSETPTPTPSATPSPTETPSPTPSPSATPTDEPGDDARWENVESWVYQLTGYTDSSLDEIAASSFDLAVIDLARDGSTDYFSREEVAAVQATGKIVLAYFEIGAIEDYRPEWPEVPDDLKLGAVYGWPGEQYVKYWDERWWPIVAGRIDQAIAAGFDGAYLDMIVTYEEISANAAGTNRQDLAQKMVDLIARVSAYAEDRDPAFKVVPQNSPELYTYTGYLEAVDGLGMEELYVLATDDICDASWCYENRANAAAVAATGRLVLTVDYANHQENVDYAYSESLAAGFVPYVTVRNLNIVRLNPGWTP